MDKDELYTFTKGYIDSSPITINIESLFYNLSDLTIAPSHIAYAWIRLSNIEQAIMIRDISEYYINKLIRESNSK